MKVSFFVICYFYYPLLGTPRFYLDFFFVLRYAKNNWNEFEQSRIRKGPNAV